MRSNHIVVEVKLCERTGGAPQWCLKSTRATLSDIIAFQVQSSQRSVVLQCQCYDDCERRAAQRKQAAELASPKSPARLLGSVFLEAQ